MKFNFNLNQILTIDSENFCILDASYANNLRPQYFSILKEIIDTMGVSATQTQNSNKYVLTSAIKFFKSNNRLYIKVQDNLIIGYIKVGVIYNEPIRDQNLNFCKKNLLTVLDFYVDTNFQHKGYGKEIFEKMMKCEKITPGKLGYESMTNPMKSFLYKYYNLSTILPQSNNISVFDIFFQNEDLNQYSFLKNELKERTPLLNKDYDIQENSSVMGKLGKNLIYNNYQDNVFNPSHGKIENQLSQSQSNYSTKSKINNGQDFKFSISKSPEKNYFSNYFLNDVLASNNGYIDRISNFKKNNLEGTPILKTPSERLFPQDIYLKESLNKQYAGNLYSKERLQELQQNISSNPGIKFYEYRKNKEYASILDNKSLRLDNRNENQFKFGTDIRKNDSFSPKPTTNSNYGAYYVLNHD